MIKKITVNLPVDAGCIGVMNVKDMIAHGADNFESCFDKESAMLLTLSEDKMIRITVEDTWCGKVGKTVNLSAGDYYVGDLCYAWNDNEKWRKFLTTTECLEKMGELGYAFDTGGDGCFDVEIEMGDTFF